MYWSFSTQQSLNNDNQHKYTCYLNSWQHCLEVRTSQLAQASERVGSLIPASQQGWKPCRRFDQMLWSSSGRRYASASMDHIYSLASHHALSPEAASRGVTGSCGIAFLKAAIQHPGSSSPPSLLREGWFSLMWIASLSISSLGVLAWSITVVSSHLIGWWFSHACTCVGEPCCEAGIREPTLSENCLGIN